jgi:predicted ribosomally synthesized peptide with nif11-like leader
MSKEDALKFLHEAEKQPKLRSQLDAVDPRETAQLLRSLSTIAAEAGYTISTGDLQAALREWTAELLADSELSRLA